jgi:uncharacterized membrane protein YdjX (TVP38/TMEM64 family)
MTKTSRNRTRLIIGIILVAVLLVAAYLLDAQRYLRQLLDWINEIGIVGGAVFVAVYVAATVLFVPGSILTLGAGFVFGVLQGTIYVSVASTLGATAAFLVGRYFARDWVAQKVSSNERFQAIDNAVGREGWKIVGLTRLSPIFPFNMLNYAYGLTKVSVKGYFFASWIGMLPGTLMYVYIGSLAGSIATLGTDGRARTTLEWILYGVGLVATVVVTVFVTRLARKALAQRVESVEEPESEDETTPTADPATDEAGGDDSSN